MKRINFQLQIDGVLVLLLLLLAVVSCVAIAGTLPSLPEKIADMPFVLQQIMWYVIGFVAIAAVMMIDFDWYQKVSWYLYGVGMILLLALFLKIPLLGSILNINGAYCWFSIPGVGLFQPSELVKVIMVLVISTVVGFVALLVYIFFAYPEFFTKYILHSYQLDRFYGWLAPNDYPTQGFQLLRGLLATGTGRLTGIGFQNSTVYIPESQTDFIFTVIANQWGFIGATVVIFLLLLLIYRILQIAANSNEPFGSYLCAGVAVLITFQVFQNIGMILGMLPITGITLPFISYGGSSLATIMLAMGFVLSVHSRTRNYMFESGKY